MSLLACPQVEFLDEPTTGVDPVSRRSLFKMLKNLRASSIVLTTHRMDEAESLCDNIAIMINGRFVCYGSPGQLKSRYGQGYSLVLKHTHDHTYMPQFVQQSLANFQIVDTVQTDEIDAYSGQPIKHTSCKAHSAQVVQQAGGLGVLIEHLNNLQVQGHILSFQITRSSLENVFVQFAKHQVEQGQN
mmetsp:Transcript_17873/g.30365  ORF Transcript_17873/g.30365 Transcript_17873/m.30365 type:complete len:187 (+) Transcript_17873:3546-4106(+)